MIGEEDKVVHNEMIRKISKHPHEGKKKYLPKNKIWLANFSHKCYDITMFYLDRHSVFHLDLHSIFHIALHIDFAVKICFML